MKTAIIIGASSGIGRALTITRSLDGYRVGARERAAARRVELDAAHVEAFARGIGELFPGCPRSTQQAIAEHACLKYSGRVGRSAAAKELDQEAMKLAVRAHVRHAQTPYDQLLARGVDRYDARRDVASEVEAVLKRWSSTEY